MHVEGVVGFVDRRLGHEAGVETVANAELLDRRLEGEGVVGGAERAGVVERQLDLAGRGLDEPPLAADP